MSNILIHSCFLVESNEFNYTVAQRVKTDDIQSLLIEQICELDPDGYYLFDFVIKDNEATIRMTEKSNFKLYSINHFVLLDNNLEDIE